LARRYYRGFELIEASGGWWATTADEFVRLGPFPDEDSAKRAVDIELNGRQQ
jgi:hypothetical protein